MRGIIIAVMLLAGAAQAADFRPGRDYEEIPFAQAPGTGDKIEVREFFWYGCPHCYSFEPALSAWRKRLPGQARFVRTPAALPQWEQHARAYYALESLGVAEKLHKPIFDAIHRDKLKLNSGEALADFVAKHGVDRAAFLRAFNGFGVRMNVKRARQLFDNLSLNSVPTIVVDGRYRTSPSLARSDENAIKVVEFLIQKAASGRRK